MGKKIKKRWVRRQIGWRRWGVTANKGSVIHQEQHSPETTQPVYFTE